MYGVAPDCPVQLQDKGSNGRLLQTPTGVRTWRAPDSEQYMSGVPITSKTSQRLGSGWRL
jgi:hypothetical protein